MEIPDRSTLLAIGVSLCFVAVMLRGFVQSNRRALALRKQHRLDVRKPGQPTSDDAFAAPLTHAEKFLPRYAQAVLVAGLLMTVLSFFRH